MNPEIIKIIEESLSRGYQVLVLTNAMRPMQRPRIKSALEMLVKQYGKQLVFRISLDHWSSAKHDELRGKGSYQISMAGMAWLNEIKATIHVAGRTLWDEDMHECRTQYQAVFDKIGVDINAFDPVETVLFPELDERFETPEITTECWSVLNKKPKQIMCSSSRMVVHRKGQPQASIIACTLLPYEPMFELGTTLEQAYQNIYLNHPHCSKFCVLGGASCAG